MERLGSLLLKCCFTSTETVGLLGTGAQNGHLDFHTQLLTSLSVHSTYCYVFFLFFLFCYFVGLLSLKPLCFVLAVGMG